MRLASLVCVVSVLVGTVGCKKIQDARRAQWLASAPACPTSATCSAKVDADGQSLLTCAPFDKANLAVGDLVVVNALGGGHDTVGRITQRRVGSLRVELPEGITLDRREVDVVGRVCH